jgi:hypothetical protein
VSIRHFVSALLKAQLVPRCLNDKARRLRKSTRRKCLIGFVARLASAGGGLSVWLAPEEIEILARQIGEYGVSSLARFEGQLNFGICSPG